MTTVYKYPLNPISDEVKIEMPSGARILHVHEQNGIPTIWALVDLAAAGAERVFAIRGTAHPVEDNLAYLGSAHCSPFVWHVFEVAK